MITYIQAIGLGFPAVQCHAVGDGSIYEDIIWDGGADLPSKDTLDAWITSNPALSANVNLTKYEFRKLFTFNERVALDSVQSNPNVSAMNKAIINTLSKDLELSAVIELYNPDVISGVNFLETVGLLGTGRAAQILANLVPA